MSYIVPKRNVVDLCRLCLGKEESLIPLFEGINQICEKINECLSIQISAHDRVSTKICSSCLIKVDTFSEFRNKTTESQRILEGWLQDLDSAVEDMNSKEPEIQNEKVISCDYSLRNSSGDEGSDNGTGSSNEEESISEESVQPSLEQGAFEIQIDQSDLINILPVIETPGPSGLQSCVDEALLELHCTVASLDNRANRRGIRKEEFAEKDTEIVTKQSHPTYISTSCNNSSSTYRVAQNFLNAESQNNNNIRENHKFQCGTCKFTARYKSQLDIHVKRHRKDYRIFCKICHRGFFYQHEIEMHEATHKEDKKFECSVCPKKFVYRHTLVAHMRKHEPNSNSKKENYRCDTCGKSFSNKSYLRKHSHIHSGVNKVICDICGMVLSSRVVLKSHHRTHTGERPYSCNLCGRSFNTKKYMTVHMRIHSGIKPFTCQDCGKSFCQQSTLMVHRRYHSGQKPYECHICKKSFVTKTILKIHQQKHSS